MRIGIDENIDRQKNKKKFIRKMKKNKYWRLGFKAAKKGSSKDDVPYKLSDEIWALLRKRTLWFIGYEEYDATFGKKHRLREMEAERKRQVKEEKRRMERAERRKEHGKNKRKKRKRKHR